KVRTLLPSTAEYGALTNQLPKRWRCYYSSWSSSRLPATSPQVITSRSSLSSALASYSTPSVLSASNSSMVPSSRNVSIASFTDSQVSSESRGRSTPEGSSDDGFPTTLNSSAYSPAAARPARMMSSVVTAATCPD